MQQSWCWAWGCRRQNVRSLFPEVSGPGGRGAICPRGVACPVVVGPASCLVRLPCVNVLAHCARGHSMRWRKWGDRETRLWRTQPAGRQRRRRGQLERLAWEQQIASEGFKRSQSERGERERAPELTSRPGTKGRRADNSDQGSPGSAQGTARGCTSCIAQRVPHRRGPWRSDDAVVLIVNSLAPVLVLLSPLDSVPVLSGSLPGHASITLPAQCSAPRHGPR